jgi:hypothetical protein
MREREEAERKEGGERGGEVSSNVTNPNCHWQPPAGKKGHVS